MSFFRRQPALLGTNNAAADRNRLEARTHNEPDDNVIPKTAVKAADARLQPLYNVVDKHLVPFYFLITLMNQLDRNNLAFAALTLNRDLQFSSSTYGLGAALFFLTFCAFQVPSNLIMVRVGVRRWLSFLVVGWGCVATCFALMHNKAGFFVLRLLLGALESGATPAMWYHISQFYPQERITKPYSFLTVANAISSVIGSPLAAGLLALNGVGGLRGWQWLFVLEGIPSVILGVLLWFMLPECPAEAKWLTEEHRELLQKDMAESIKLSPPREKIPRSPAKLFKLACYNPLMIYMAIISFGFAMASYTYIFWLPVIVAALLNGTALTAATTAAAQGSLELKPILLTSIPYACCAVFCWAVAHHSQKRNELYWHTGLCFLVSGLFFVLFPVMAKASVAAGFASLVLMAATGAAGVGPLNAVAMRATTGPGQVLAMAVYSSISVIGGFCGPFIVGILLGQVGGFIKVCSIMGATMLACGVMVITVKRLAGWRDRRLQRATGSALHDCESPLPDSRDNSGPNLGLKDPPAGAASVAPPPSCVGKVSASPACGVT